MCIISIIVPVYKAESYLHRCVDSLLAQTFPDFEILLIDDGSPDRSGQICDEYALQDERVRVIHKSNGGVASARQCGLENAQGEYIIHADPDDWVEPKMLDLLYAKAKDEDADMVICDYYIEREGKRIFVKQQPSDLNSETVLRELFQHLHGSCWNKLVRRRCFNEYDISFSQDLSYCEDLLVCCKLLLHNIRVAYLNQAFYHYVQCENENSLVLMRTKDQDLLLIDYMKNLLPPSLFANIAFPLLTFGLAMHSWMQEDMSARTYRYVIRPYRWKILQNTKASIAWRIVLFISSFGLKDILYSIYKKWNKV